MILFLGRAVIENCRCLQGDCRSLCQTPKPSARPEDRRKGTLSKAKALESHATGHGETGGGLWAMLRRLRQRLDPPAMAHRHLERDFRFRAGLEQVLAWLERQRPDGALPSGNQVEDHLFPLRPSKPWVTAAARFRRSEGLKRFQRLGPQPTPPGGC